MLVSDFSVGGLSELNEEPWFCALKGHRTVATGEGFAQPVDSDTQLSLALKGRRTSSAPSGRSSVGVSGSTGYAKRSTRGYIP